MLVAAAVCPAAPLLIDAIGRGLGPDAAELRRRVAAAVDALWEAAADLVVIVGADAQPHAVDLTAWAPGAPELPRLDVPEPLPLPLLLGAALTPGRLRSFLAVDPALDPADCAALGADLAGAAPRVAMLVMGDGAARHDVKAPGYVDPRSAPYDERVAAAFAAADAGALLRLDVEESAALLAAGRAPWQVLAGAAQAATGHWQAGEAWFHAPYGVGYHVVTWRVAGAAVTATNEVR